MDCRKGLGRRGLSTLVNDRTRRSLCISGHVPPDPLPAPRRETLAPPIYSVPLHVRFTAVRRVCVSFATAAAAAATALWRPLSPAGVQRRPRSRPSPPTVARHVRRLRRRWWEGTPFGGGGGRARTHTAATTGALFSHTRKLRQRQAADTQYGFRANGSRSRVRPVKRNNFLSKK